MKVEFVSISNAVFDFLSDFGIGHGSYDYNTLVKWASDAVKWFQTDQQLRHRIAIIRIENSRGDLPMDYKMLGQAASHVFPPNPCDCSFDPEQDCCKDGKRIKPQAIDITRRETVVEWTAKTLEHECEAKIRLLCPKCHKTDCDHRLNVFEVDIDNLWRAAHPEAYYTHFTRFGNFGYGGKTSYYSPKFKMMNYAINDFFKANEILGNCPNIDCHDCENSFSIERPYIEVDFQKGEVLLSYLGVVLDDLGEVMVPDHQDVHDAILNHLAYKWFVMKMAKEENPNLLTLANQFEAKRDRSIAIANSQLKMPSFQEWKAWLQQSSWLKRIPNWSSDNAGKNIPDVYKGYLEDPGNYNHNPLKY